MPWFIHDGLLQYVEHGDMPPGVVEIEPPDGMLERPERFTVVVDRLVQHGSEEAKEHLQRQAAVLKLTQEEIAAVKKAFAENRL